MLFGFGFVLLSLFSCKENVTQVDLTVLGDELKASFSTGDSLFSQPFVDRDEWREEPLKHRYVHGGFEGTRTRFSFYFPPEDQYQGRFFQYITPFPDNENLSQGASGEDDRIGFSIESGAYFVETNGGGAIDFADPRAGDATIGAYRANAACAEFSRVVAGRIFGGSRPYGYCFGGSGGAYRTIGGMENTEGIWDGAVPYVLGSPMAIPNVFTVRMHAMRTLKDKFPQIVDALEPGGSGDMYAGLNEEEKSALEEVTKMGFPPGAWYAYETMGIHGFTVLYQGVVMADQPYFTDDFWNKEGYLGADPPASLLKARIQKKSTIKRLILIDEAVDLGLIQPMSPEDRGSADLAWKSMGGTEGGMPVAFQLDDGMPEVGFLGGDLIMESGSAEGSSLFITKIDGDKVVLGPTNSPASLVPVKTGDEVLIDNSNFLAVQTYHRHQVPGPEYKVYDQFRDREGNPVYPQRPMLLGPMFTMGAAGSLPTGRFSGRMILLGSLWDREAFPWQCDWYRERVKEFLGDNTDDHFRLWYTERAIHGDASAQLDDPTRVVSYVGVLQQALRDLSAWVEKGIPPSPTTNYKILDGQVVVPPTASERSGIQPVIVAQVNGGKRADIPAGEPLSFQAEVSLPENTGSVVKVAWDFDGTGEFADVLDIEDGQTKLTTETSYAIDRPGTYFPAVRVTSQREGNSNTPFSRIQNLDRVRVIVR